MQRLNGLNNTKKIGLTIYLHTQYVFELILVWTRNKSFLQFQLGKNTSDCLKIRKMFLIAQVYSKNLEIVRIPKCQLFAGNQASNIFRERYNAWFRSISSSTDPHATKLITRNQKFSQHHLSPRVYFLVLCLCEQCQGRVCALLQVESYKPHLLYAFHHICSLLSIFPRRRNQHRRCYRWRCCVRKSKTLSPNSKAKWSTRRCVSQTIMTVQCRLSSWPQISEKMAY